MFYCFQLTQRYGPVCIPSPTGSDGRHQAARLFQVFLQQEISASGPSGVTLENLGTRKMRIFAPDIKDGHQETKQWRETFSRKLNGFDGNIFCQVSDTFIFRLPFRSFDNIYQNSHTISMLFIEILLLVTQCYLFYLVQMAQDLQPSSYWA